MSSIEEEVISYIALTGDLDTVVGQAGGITAEHFLDPETRKVFSSILAFKADFGEPPTPEVIGRDHPNFPFTEESSGPIEYLLRELHEQRRRTIIDLGMGAVGEALDKGGSEAALPLLRMMLAHATTATAGFPRSRLRGHRRPATGRLPPGPRQPGRVVGHPYRVCLP